jgi:hypothetical protein
MSSKYDSSAEGLHDLLSSHRITKMSTILWYLTNRVKYTFAQISCVDGSKYGLQAYDKEALKLHKALEKLAKPQV